MSLIFDWFDKIKRYWKLKPDELRASIITVLAMAFAISFNKWGPGSEPDIGYGLLNLMAAIIIVAISFYSRLMFQKIVALGADYQARYRMWSIGIFIMLLLVFLSNGRLWFVIPGGIIISYMQGNRLGWVRYGLNMFGVGVISVAGPIANIILAILFRTLFELTKMQWFYTAFLLNLVWALWTMLPIPPSDGSRMFFGSRMVYMWCLAVIITSSILLYSKINVWITIAASILTAWVWWLIYYIIWERFNWKGPY